MSNAVNYCTSFTGIVTFSIVVATTSRMVLSHMRIKHGEDSQFYRNAKTIMAMLYVIAVINLLRVSWHNVISHLDAFCCSIVNYLADNRWVIGVILVVVFLGLSYKSFATNHPLPMWIGTLVVIAGTQLLTQDNTHRFTWEAIMVGIIAVPFSFFATISMETAYLAGEYSLIPKLIERIKRVASAKAE